MATGRLPDPNSSPLTAKGDLYTYSTVPAKLAVGNSGETLVADSSTATGLKWQADTVNTVIDAKADLLVGTAADTLTRLAVGTNGQVLTADSTTATGLKWATGSSGAGALTKITSGSFTAVSSVTISNCFTTTYNKYMAIIRVSCNTAGSDIQLQGRYGTTTVTAGYYGSCARLDRNNTTTNAGYVNANQATLQDSSESTESNFFQIFFDGTATASTNLRWFGNGFIESSQSYSYFAGRVDNPQNYTGFVLLPSASNFTGTYAIYGLEA